MKLNVLPHNDHNNGWLNILPPLAAANVLSGNHHFDYVVVGGGYTGLSAARRLAELRSDARIALIDGDRIGNNAAGRSSGFAIDQAHNIRAKNFGDNLDNERDQIKLNRAGQEAIKEAVDKNGIDCDWRDCGKIHGAGTKKGQAFLRTYAGNLDMLGANYEFYSADKMRSITGLDFYREGLFTPGTQQLQPAALVRGLAETMPETVSVFESSMVTDVEYGEPHRLITSDGEATATTLVLANNGFGTAFGFYQDSVIPLPTYASMTRELKPDELDALRGEEVWGVIPAHPFGSTIRRLRENRILVRNIYAYTPDHNPTEQHRLWARKKHRKSFLNRFPMLSNVEFEYSWGGSLCLSDNGAPIFGELRKNVFASLCHNGVGIARGTICGKLIAEHACGESSELVDLMLNAGRPNKTLPKWILRIGAPINLANRRRQAGLEL
ncbi:MAG: FAD-binding oxidoreductase [Pseudomonadota bacterium]